MLVILYRQNGQLEVFWLCCFGTCVCYCDENEKHISERNVFLCRPQTQSILGKQNMFCICNEEVLGFTGILAIKCPAGINNLKLVNWPQSASHTHTPNPQSLMHQTVWQRTLRWTLNYTNWQIMRQVWGKTANLENFNFLMIERSKTLIQPTFWNTSGDRVLWNSFCSKTMPKQIVVTNMSLFDAPSSKHRLSFAIFANPDFVNCSFLAPHSKTLFFSFRFWFDLLCASSSSSFST